MSLIRLGRALLCPAVLFLLTTSGLTLRVSAQGLLPFDRDLAEEMLKARAASVAAPFSFPRAVST